MIDSGKIEKNREIEGFKKLNNGQQRFAKGNQFGRMPKKGFNLTDLNKLVRKYDKTQDISLLEHYVEQLRKDNRLLDKYMDKNVPTKNEFTGPDGQPLNQTIVLYEKVYQDCPLKAIGQCPVKEKVKQVGESLEK